MRYTPLETEDLLGRSIAMGQAFGSNDPLPVEIYESMEQAPDYHRDLHLLIMAPDQTVAAFALVWPDLTNQIGIFEPVGTVPNHQQKGLGKAVMYEGFRRLQARGIRTAFVHTGSTVPPTRLYQAVGFVPYGIEHPWVKVF